MPPPRMSPATKSSSIFLFSAGLSWLSRGVLEAGLQRVRPSPRGTPRSHVKPRARAADTGSIMSRALSFLAALASPVFVCAAIAGWLFEVWPANPLTLGVSGFLVVGGPILGIVHVATAKGLDDADDEAVEEET